MASRRNKSINYFLLGDHYSDDIIFEPVIFKGHGQYSSSTSDIAYVLLMLFCNCSYNCTATAPRIEINFKSFP